MRNTTHIRQFDYNPQTRQFTAEVSDTSGLERVWADSADLGLTIANPDTSRAVTFVVTDEAHDTEGDLTYWALVSVTGNRPDGRFTLTLYND